MLSCGGLISRRAVKPETAVSTSWQHQAFLHAKLPALDPSCAGVAGGCVMACAESASFTWRRLQHAAAKHIKGLPEQLLHPVRALRWQPVPAAGSSRQRQIPAAARARAVHAADRCIRKGCSVHRVLADNQVHGYSSTHQAFTLKVVSLQHSSKTTVSSAVLARPNRKLPQRSCGPPYTVRATARGTALLAIQGAMAAMLPQIECPIQ